MSWNGEKKRNSPNVKRKMHFFETENHWPYILMLVYVHVYLSGADISSVVLRIRGATVPLGRAWFQLACRSPLCQTLQVGAPGTPHVNVNMWCRIEELSNANSTVMLVDMYACVCSTWLEGYAVMCHCLLSGRRPLKHRDSWEGSGGRRSVHCCWSAVPTNVCK